MSRTDFAYEMLRRALRDKQYRPGDRIREAEVAKQLGISRTPVREAMNRLTSERLLVESQSRGIMVAKLRKQDVRELYALREVLEGTAAGFAAAHASEDEIAAMHSCLEQSKAHLDDSPMQYRLNEHLHNTIYDAARNRYLSQALHKLADSLDLLSGSTYFEPYRPAEAYDEHLSIVQAITDRDPDAAEQTARAHMRSACRVRMRQMFELRV